jgi:26S proteasome regulatory subunit N2
MTRLSLINMKIPWLVSVPLMAKDLSAAATSLIIISLQSWAGSRNTSAIMGMVLFCQFWYWYPLTHCACLAFEPTCIIGLNADLKVSFGG